VVIDTNVVFEGLTRQGGAAGLVIDAWLGRLLIAVVSNALAYEYADVLSRKLSPRRWTTVSPVLGALLERSKFVTVHYSWRPIGPDTADGHVIDCAMNAGAAVVTSNVKHFRMAQTSLGLYLLTPLELVTRLVKE